MLMHWSISLGEDRSSCSVDEGGSKAGLRKEESPEDIGMEYSVREYLSDYLGVDSVEWNCA